MVIVRKSVRFMLLILLSLIVLAGIISLFYKPLYEVSLYGEVIGYTNDKSQVQTELTNFIDSTGEENVAFVQLDATPTYKICLIKKDVETNEDEIISLVTENCTEYFKYYAITDDKEEKVFVASYEEAESIIEQLTQKGSANTSDLGIIEKYDTKLTEFTDEDTSVAELYEEKVVVKTYATASASNYSSVKSTAYVDLGFSLINPVSGVITSRYGSTSTRKNHGGLDIGAPKGTSIVAAATGIVTFAGNANDGYGYYVIISHSNNVQTLYAHCSELLVSKGDTVTQGELIARVGSTGNSTGNHLHLEVRKNGVTYDPQNYVY